MQNPKKVTGLSAQKLLGLALGIESNREDLDREEFNQRIFEYSNERRTLCFKEVDFQKLRERAKKETLEFNNLNFLQCLVDFSECDFGDGNIDFTSTGFHGGVTFEGAKFGKGNILFDLATLSNASFDRAHFSGKGSLSFRGATFNGITTLAFEELGPKDLDFSRKLTPKDDSTPFTKFNGEGLSLDTGLHSGGEVTFNGSVFSCKAVNLQFGGSTELTLMDLRSTTWHCHHVNIQNIQLFKTGGKFFLRDTDLSQTRNFSLLTCRIPDGSIDCSYTKFPESGLTLFEFGDLGGGAVDFKNATFGASVQIKQKEGARCDSQFSFRGATFRGSLDISGLAFETVPDLIGTEFSKHLSLHGVSYKYPWLPRLFFIPDPDQTNGAKLQRLKELAENNQDHRLALKCHADEMRAKRWQSNKGPWAHASDLWDLGYELLSNCGQSIALPVFWLFMSWFIFAGCYGLVSAKLLVIEYTDLLLFAATMSVPFLPVSRTVRDNELIDLFGNPETVDLFCVYMLMGIQGILSVIFLFLIGLGLRNRFRV